MPTARDGAFIGVIGTKIYVVGGTNSSTDLSVNEIYDTITNTWTTGAPMPTPRWLGAFAVIDNVLYAMGGEAGYTLINVVEAYDFATDTWFTKAPLPIAMNSVYAVADRHFIFYPRRLQPCQRQDFGCASTIQQRTSGARGPHLK